MTLNVSSEELGMVEDAATAEGISRTELIVRAVREHLGHKNNP
jgi:uncharacterized protein (DUF1778 family)